VAKPAAKATPTAKLIFTIPAANTGLTRTKSIATFPLHDKNAQQVSTERHILSIQKFKLT